jgi:uncharacterized membrane protein
MAVLAHVLQLVGGWIAPLVIFLIKRNSRFVSFHALQALLLQGLYFLAMLLMVGSVLVLGVSSMIFHQPAQHNSLPPGFVILFPLIWLGAMGCWALMLVVAIVYGIKAGRGEWSAYPLLGALARKILKIGPEGESLA